MKRILPQWCAALVLGITAMLPPAAGAHGGGLDAQGCHTNQRTGEYHCHRGRERPAAISTLTGTASVIDGDTLEIHGERIRLEGIDAPESAQRCERAGRQWRCGQQAANQLAKVIGRRPVECRSQARDRYGRLIATCYLQGVDLNEWLVGQGLALAYRQYSTAYVEAEREARQAGRGLWAGTFDKPWEWRAQRRR